MLKCRASLWVWEARGVGRGERHSPTSQGRGRGGGLQERMKADTNCIVVMGFSLYCTL
jgi:hypothetical protein